MPKVKNISTGPRGAYLGGAYVEAEAGAIIDADDFSPEWFEAVSAKDPLDHDNDGKRGGSKPRNRATQA